MYADAMTVEERHLADRLKVAILDLDLQLYKGSIYKLRWGTPGGLDMALPCYDRAIGTLDDTDWPSVLRGPANDLRERVAAYRRTLHDRDVTTASAQHSRMMLAFEALREAVRRWPKLPDEGATRTPQEGPGRLAMDEAAPDA